MDNHILIDGYCDCRFYKYDESNGYLDITEILKMSSITTIEDAMPADWRFYTNIIINFDDVIASTKKLKNFNNFAIAGLQKDRPIERSYVDVAIGRVNNVRFDESAFYSHMQIEGVIDSLPDKRIIHSIEAKYIRDFFTENAFLNHIYNWSIDKNSSIYQYIGSNAKSKENDMLAIRKPTYSFGKSIGSVRFDEHITYCIPKIRKIIFNDPATIIYWSDDTKTVVKAANGETFNKEIGLAMAMSNKFIELYGEEYPRATFKSLVKNAIDNSQKTAEKKANKSKDN